ncbi:MAG: SDR family oxidoreductase [Gemmatimonadota bacterium]
MSSLKIDGSVALVTGANRGIGRALVESLLDHGAGKVYVGARRLEAVTDLVERYGDRVEPVLIDVTDRDQVRAAVASATDVDLLFNNAGVAEFMGGDFVDEAWFDAGRREYDVNVLGTFDVTRAFAPVLAANGGGAVVNVISVAGLVNFPLFLSYSLSKAALHSLTQATRLLLADQGTRTFGVYPGPVDTDMAEPLDWDKASPRSVADVILAGIEAGTEEIFTDSMARQFGTQYASDPKSLEANIAAMVEEIAA